jgi:hypothetical protein
MIFSRIRRNFYFILKHKKPLIHYELKAFKIDCVTPAGLEPATLRAEI